MILGATMDDKTILGEVERAISKADLGLTRLTTGM